MDEERWERWNGLAQQNMYIKIKSALKRFRMPKRDTLISFSARKVAIPF